MSTAVAFPDQPFSLPTITVGKPQRRREPRANEYLTPSPAREIFITEMKNALVAAITDRQSDADCGTPSSDAIVYAWLFLTMLPTSTPVPEVAADLDGDIAIDWDHGPRRVFSVRVGKGGRLYYAGLFGHATVHGSEDLGSSLPPAIRDGLERVARDHPA